jgi:hypothetical protein
MQPYLTTNINANDILTLLERYWSSDGFPASDRHNGFRSEGYITWTFFAGGLH